MADDMRTKRRQAAEEMAAKVGVKLVFPLVFFLFPALYVVILGPAVIQFIRVFSRPAVRAGRLPPQPPAVPAEGVETDDGHVILFALAAVFLVLYLTRRRARLRKDE